MTPAELALERRADELLKPYSDVFSEAQLSRRARRQQPLAMRYYATLQHLTDYSQFKTDCWKVIHDCARRQRVNTTTCGYLHYLAQGMSYREIAQLCKVTHPTISAAIKTAAKQIRLDPYHDLYEVIALEFELSVSQVRDYCRALIRG